MRYDTDDDLGDDPGDDPEAPDAADTDDGDTDLLTPCANCRRMMFDDAEQCPHCGRAVIDNPSATSHAPWVVVTVFICLIVALVTWVF